MSLSKLWELVIDKEAWHVEVYGVTKRRTQLRNWTVLYLDSILKSRDITFPTKVCLVKVMVFPVVMYGCEIWTIKKAEHWKVDAFELWCWRRLLKSPLDYKEIQPVHPKGNQPWIFIGRTEAEAEAPILWPPDVKNWLIGKDPDAGRDWRQEEKGTTEDEMVDGISDSMDMNLSSLLQTMKDRETWHAAVHGFTKNQTRLSDWATTTGPNHQNIQPWSINIKDHHRFMYSSTKSYWES